MLTSFTNRLKQLSKRRLYRYGVPFLLLMVGGSIGLKEFTALRYQFRSGFQVTRAEAERAGVKMKKAGEVTLESEYEKIKNVDIDNWENKRGPRPWEENVK